MRDLRFARNCLSLFSFIICFALSAGRILIYRESRWERSNISRGNGWIDRQLRINQIECLRRDLLALI